MPTAVITGCNSGIGHAMAQILIKEGYDVYAVDLNLGEKLSALHGPKCKIGRLDVASMESIRDFKSIFGDQKLDVLLNIAGIMVTPSTDGLTTTNLANLEKSFAINTYGPFLLTQALLQNILASDASPPHIAVTSSRVGSIADNSTGGYYAYRASKTAVNSLFKSLSVDPLIKDKGIVVSMLHPGFTKTNLDPDIHKIPEAVEPEEAAEKLWALVKQKTVADSGKFWHREGMELPW